MSLLQDVKSFLKRMRSPTSKIRQNEKTANGDEMKTTVLNHDPRATSTTSYVSSDLPVYLEYVSQNEREHKTTYGIKCQQHENSEYTLYKSLANGFPLPDPHDKQGCELLLGYCLFPLPQKKSGDSDLTKKIQKQLNLLTQEEKDFVREKLQEAADGLKDKKRQFWHVILQNVRQADWCVVQAMKSTRVTDLCVAIYPDDEEVVSRHPDCSGKETYKLEDKTDSTKSLPPQNQTSHTSRGGYGYANNYRGNYCRPDGKRWCYDTRAWIEDVPKPIHPTPVLLEGEKIVEIPEA